MVRMPSRRPIGDRRQHPPKPARRIATAAALAVLLLAGLPASIGGASTAGAALPATNGDLLFRDVQGGDSELYRVAADGTGMRDVSRAPAAQDLDPSWNPTGTLIAYARKTTGSQVPPDIWVMFADGSGRTRLTTDSVPERQPAWSPDGSHIAYARAPGGNFGGFHIWVMGAGGSFPHQVTNPWNQASDTDPAWSPDGTLIAFTGFVLGDGNKDLYVMAADGSSVARLTSDPAAELAPAWQPEVACTIAGTWRRDNLIGTPGPDVICGNGAADVIAGGGGNDVIYGGGGSDQIDAGDGDDVVLGGGGYDKITGGTGFDWINGGLKNDTCSAEPDGGVMTSCETIAG